MRTGDVHLRIPLVISTTTQFLHEHGTLKWKAPIETHLSSCPSKFSTAIFRSPDDGYFPGVRVHEASTGCKNRIHTID